MSMMQVDIRLPELQTLVRGSGAGARRTRTAAFGGQCSPNALRSTHQRGLTAV